MFARHPTETTSLEAKVLHGTVAMRLLQVFKNIIKWYEITLADWPWFRSAAITAPLAGAIFFLIDKLPANRQINLSDANIYVILTCSIIFLYLLLVAVLFKAKLLTERQLRAAEDSFRYDNRGTLFHGTQPAIAFRVITFRSMLEGLEVANPSAFRDALFEAGLDAAKDFAQHLPELYDLNVHRLRGGYRWMDLSFPEKLQKWTDYDSATGWGIIAAHIDGKNISITVTHYNGLFDPPPLFASFLAGYCKTVIQTVLSAEKGAYRGFRSVDFNEIKNDQLETVKIIYALT